MTYYYGINHGAEYQTTSTSTSSTTSKDIEIVVNNTNVPSKADLIVALEKLEAAVQRSNWPL